MDGDDLGNRLGSDGEGVVGLAEGIEEGEVGVDLAQPLVVDDEQGIDVLRHLLHAVESLVNLAVALESEGDGDDAHGEDAHLLRHLSDDGGCAGAGAAAHAGGDEGHAGAVAEHILDLVEAFLCSSTGTGRTVAGAKAFMAQLQLHGHG